MTSPIADSVMAATHKLVQQAMQGEWQEVPRTVEQRRALLDQLTANATVQDQQWLGALRQAMSESDAAVAQMAAADVPALEVPGAQAVASSPPIDIDPTSSALDRVASTLEMLARRG
jgi:recombinational DNA repair ATPase RecF